MKKYQSIISLDYSDTEELSKIPDAIYIPAAGYAKVVTEAGDTVTISGLQAGTVLELAVKQIYSTGTNITGILGLR